MQDNKPVMYSILAFEKLALVAAVIVVAVTTYYWFWWKRRNQSSHHYHRRTSLASAMQAARPLLVESLGMTQNVVNVILFFDDDESPNQDHVVQIMSTFCHKFARMRSRPRFLSDDTTCVWDEIDDLDAAIQRAVTVDNTIVHDDDEEYHDKKVLQRAASYCSEMLLGQDEQGRPMPYWRAIVLNSNALLVRIDHAIGDGLALVTLLKEVGTKKSLDGKEDQPLELGDLSPLFQRFLQAGDWRISLRPLTLLWPLNLWRAVSFLASTLSSPLEPFNPLRVPEQHFLKPIPSENCTFLYFPTISLEFLKKLARASGSAIGNKTTLNDVLLVCLADAISRYFQQVGVDLDEIRLLLPIGNPIRPSLYGDEYEGLCNRMTPVAFPLKLGLNSTEALQCVQQTVKKVKKSCITTLMLTLNSISDRLLTVRDVASGPAAQVFSRVSCIYSNVAGPTEAIWLAGCHMTRIQVIMPHPTSIFQALSYNGLVFCNITLDNRSAPQLHLLRAAFVDAINNFASTYSVVVPDKAIDESAWGGREAVYAGVQQFD